MLASRLPVARSVIYDPEPGVRSFQVSPCFFYLLDPLQVYGVLGIVVVGEIEQALDQVVVLVHKLPLSKCGLSLLGLPRMHPGSSLFHLLKHHFLTESVLD